MVSSSVGILKKLKLCLPSYSELKPVIHRARKRRPSPLNEGLDIPLVASVGFSAVNKYPVLYFWHIQTNGFTVQLSRLSRLWNWHSPPWHKTLLWRDSYPINIFLWTTKMMKTAIYKGIFNLGSLSRKIFVGGNPRKRSWPLLTHTYSALSFYMHCFSPTLGVPMKLIFGKPAYFDRTRKNM